ncbi:MAG TPA: Nif3-like dinuclear metal center hexameric protein [Tepidisphaeraceae bacterium]|nr:Nif3-like dinuclear metal center hexameric protein [Tepidisphaeraceae bacterium]
MRLCELLSVLDDLAPLRYAEPWDNVGLLVGDPAQEIHKLLLTIDYTAQVAAEAHQEHCDAILAYHPPIFDPLKRIPSPSLIHDAIRRGLAIYSPHTALDIADGGTNDMLADVLGLVDRQPLRPNTPTSTHYKLVVFVPSDAAEAVASALFNAGAGHIGNYSACSFRSPGTATFFGEQGSHPAVGQANQLERVDELRLETVLPLDRLTPAIKALQQAHPYEEPAFDLVPLAARPDGKGQGRIGTLPAPTPREELFTRIKHELGLSHLLIAGSTTGHASTAAVGAGACGNMLDDALAQKADLYLTGEVRHHDALKAAQRGMTVVCTLHSNSERAVLKRLASRISYNLPDLPLHISRHDHDPFSVWA